MCWISTGGLSALKGVSSHLICISKKCVFCSLGGPLTFMTHSLSPLVSLFDRSEPTHGPRTVLDRLWRAGNLNGRHTTRCRCPACEACVVSLEAEPRQMPSRRCDEDTSSLEPMLGLGLLQSGGHFIQLPTCSPTAKQHSQWSASVTQPQEQHHLEQHTVHRSREQSDCITRHMA